MKCSKSVSVFLVLLLAGYATVTIAAPPMAVNPARIRLEDPVESPRNDPSPSEPLENAHPEQAPPQKPAWSKEKKFLAINGVSTAAVAVYGVGLWGYAANGFDVVHEDWFSQGTAYGGADKLGHAYSAMVAATAFAELYDRWGFEPTRANVYGALSSMYLFTLIEVGDGSSKHGFSPEDIVADACGTALGFLRRQYPSVRNKLDFRVEYIPTESVYRDAKLDVTTDYSGFKYLLALKASGFEALNEGWLQYLECQVGYYTRGFTNGDKEYFDEQTRSWYAGVGLNLSHLFDKAGHEKTSTFLNYYQVPFTYLANDWDLEQ